MARTDDEFDTTDVHDPLAGWTTFGSPLARNVTATVKLEYHLSLVAGNRGMTAIYKTEPKRRSITVLRADKIMVRED